jgi:hypothetical protein
VNKKVDYGEFDFLNFWGLWKDYPDPHSNFPGPVVEVGFYVNMDESFLILFDHRTKKQLKRQEIKKEWKTICPAVYFKHEVSISISSDAIRGKPDWISI